MAPGALLDQMAGEIILVRALHDDDYRPALLFGRNIETK
jgi:hypothetical protein